MVSDYVLVPTNILTANKHVTLSANLFFMNRQPFLATISDHLRFSTTEYMPSQKLPQLVKGMKNVASLYSSQGFEVTTSLMDGEFAPL